MKRILQKGEGPTEIRTRVARFKVWSDSHYTIGPTDTSSHSALAFLPLHSLSITGQN